VKREVWSSNFLPLISRITDQNTFMTKNIILKSISFYLFWAILAVLGAVVALQLQITFVYLGLLLIQSPLRPTGWNTSTISGISRCGYLVFGILWLGLVLYLERYLNAGYTEGRLGLYFIRLTLILGGVYLFCGALLYGLG
jgi:hypothetical protein